MLYILLTLLIWGSSFVAAKYAYTMFDPVLTVQFRLIIAAIMVSPTFFSAYRSIPKSLIKYVWVLALGNFPVVFLLQFIGLKYTSVSSAVTLIATEPMMILLLNHLFFAKKAKIVDWLLCAIAFVGIFITVIGGKGMGTVTLLGSSLILIGGFIFALCTLFGKDVMAQLDPKAYTSVILVLGAILCVPFTAVLTQDWHITPNILGIVAVFYLGLGSSWLAYRFWNKGLSVCDANTSAVLISLEPIFGIMFAMLLLGERMSGMVAVGSAIVITAAMTSGWLSTRNSTSKP